MVMLGVLTMRGDLTDTLMTLPRMMETLELTMLIIYPSHLDQKLIVQMDKSQVVLRLVAWWM